MTGFERTKFVSLPEGMEEELACAICLNILNDPMTTPCCQTSYCRKCIHDCLLLSSSGSSTCPSCRASLTAANLMPLPRFVRNILDKLDVFCDNELNGCTQIVKLGELSHHLTECPFDPNSSALKCNQLIKYINQSIDRLQTIITKEDYDNLKKGLYVLQKEVVKISSPDNSNKDKQKSSNISMGDTSQRHNNIVSEQSLIESARNHLDNLEITESNIKSAVLLSRIQRKCRKAILDFNDFKQISDYLVDNLSNDYYDWLALVYSTHSTVQMSLIGDIVYTITINFGELSIKLLSYLSYLEVEPI